MESDQQNDFLLSVFIVIGVFGLIIMGWWVMFKLVLSKFKFVRTIMGLEKGEETPPRKTRPRRIARKD